jgi:ferredoxin--NADP+ reductase
VIGSGPSGFYATEALFKSGLRIQVDMYERLPVPYGLVRSGVAPDHPKLKQVIQIYAGIARTPGFRFFGNVTIGRDITVQMLQSIYDAIIYTCGAESDRRLGIAGEDLPGSHTATEFVGWYNGHPDYRDRIFDLSHETAVIFGQGNVAELKNTDIAAHALEVLAESRIRNIHVIGRRGPAQAKFTSKELKEFGDLENAIATIDPAELRLNPASEIELADKSNAGTRKVFEIFTEFANGTGAAPGKRHVCFSFLKSPVELTGTGRVEKVRLERNVLAGNAFQQIARGTGDFIELETGIVFRSIGYRGKPIAGLPFDEKQGLIPNREGRIIDGNSVLPFQYVAGWIKRGPTGIIGTNRADSVETVGAMLADLQQCGAAGKVNRDADPLLLLAAAGIKVVTFDDWEKIDQLEISRGIGAGKPREKFTRVNEILALLA